MKSRYKCPYVKGLRSSIMRPKRKKHPKGGWTGKESIKSKDLDKELAMVFG